MLFCLEVDRLGLSFAMTVLSFCVAKKNSETETPLLLTVLLHKKFKVAEFPRIRKNTS